MLKIKTLFRYLIIVCPLIFMIFLAKTTSTYFTKEFEKNYNHKINHIAIIMDGNRRWAKERSLPISEGHLAGANAIWEVINFCLEKEIKYLSLYTFSIENNNRPEEEKKSILQLAENYFSKNKDRLKEENVKIRFIGDISYFPPNIVDTIKEIEFSTKNNNSLNLSFMLFYGGQQEILSAAKNLCSLVEKGELNSDEINKDLFEKELWSFSLPHPELLLRTGKQKRLSNFMIWQTAYTELMFVDYYWPEISKDKLESCCQLFLKTQRNFGC
jgi:undecaprenyl diphosphate synthase